MTQTCLKSGMILHVDKEHTDHLNLLERQRIH